MLEYLRRQNAGQSKKAYTGTILGTIGPPKISKGGKGKGLGQLYAIFLHEPGFETVVKAAEGEFSIGERKKVMVQECDPRAGTLILKRCNV